MSNFRVFNQTKKRKYQYFYVRSTRSQNTSLDNRHSSVHTADRNRYPCPQCKKAFPDKYKLDRHVEGVHVNAKNYVCHRCPKQFSVHAQLKRHVDQVGMRGRRLHGKLFMSRPKNSDPVIFCLINIYRFTRAFADTTVIFAKEASSKHKSFVLTSWLCTRT